MEMSFEDMFDGKTMVGRRLQINLDVALRIDDGCFAFGADEVRGMSKTTEVKLFEVHGRISPS
jgi:hypothetical protein